MKITQDVFKRFCQLENVKTDFESEETALAPQKIQYKTIP